VLAAVGAGYRRAETAVAEGGSRGVRIRDLELAESHGPHAKRTRTGSPELLGGRTLIRVATARWLVHPEPPKPIKASLRDHRPLTRCATAFNLTGCEGDGESGWRAGGAAVSHTTYKVRC
jgi:hypothetical protein